MKGAVLAAVSSPKWISSIHGLDVFERQNGHSDFGGGEDDVTSAAVGLVLDSLDDIHCLLEAKYQVGHDSNSMIVFYKLMGQSRALFYMKIQI